MNLEGIVGMMMKCNYVCESLHNYVVITTSYIGVGTGGGRRGQGSHNILPSRLY